ncbi:unnamed protein product [Lathyrus oleraceus]
MQSKGNNKTLVVDSKRHVSLAWNRVVRRPRGRFCGIGCWCYVVGEGVAIDFPTKGDVVQRGNDYSTPVVR